MKFFLSIIPFLFYAFFLQSQDIYSPENGKKFAGYLFKSGQYELAAMEYERLLFLNKEDDSLKVALVNSYFKNNSISKALNRTESLYPSTNKFSTEMSELYLQMLILDRRFNQFDQQVDQVNLNTPQKNIYELHRWVLAQDWEKTSSSFAKLNLQSHPSILPLSTLIEKSNNFKAKKPWLAVLMSSIIPGSGKFYTGDVKDGIFSLIAIGGTAFQSYRGFAKDGTSSTVGWVFGGLATGFYAGNLYGSGKAAQVYNQNYWLGIEKDAEEIIRTSY